MVVPVWGVLQAASILHFVFSDPRRSGVGCVLDTLTTRLSASPASGPGAGILGAEPQPRQNGFGKIVVEVSGLFRRSTLLGLLAPAPVEFLGCACRVTEGCFSISPGCCEAASRWCGRGGVPSATRGRLPIPGALGACLLSPCSPPRTAGADDPMEACCADGHRMATEHRDCSLPYASESKECRYVCQRFTRRASL